MKNTISKSEITTVCIFLTIGILSRTVFHFAPNFEFTTAIGVSSVLFIKRKWLALCVPLVILAITDLIIGNSIIFLFTWSGFLFAPLLTILLNRGSDLEKLATGIFSGVVGVFIFYFWTNFGVILTTQMYDISVYGYIQSLTAALPFLRIQLQSVLFTLPLIWSLGYLIKNQRLVYSAFRNDSIT